MEKNSQKFETSKCKLWNLIQFPIEKKNNIYLQSMHNNENAVIRTFYLQKENTIKLLNTPTKLKHAWNLVGCKKMKTVAAYL